MSAFLAAHHEAIRTMVRMVGARICRDRGWDLDDLASEVMVALAHKQETASRFDPARSTLDYYLRMVTRSVVGTWLRRRVDADPRDEAVSSDMPIDEVGLEDDQAALLAEVLADARRVLHTPCETPYRTLVAWLMADDVSALARATTLDELDVLRYLAKMLARLERLALPKWRLVWRRHRSSVYRQITQQRRAPQGRPPAPLRRPKGSG